MCEWMNEWRSNVVIQGMQETTRTCRHSSRATHVMPEPSSVMTRYALNLPLQDRSTGNDADPYGQHYPYRQEERGKHSAWVQTYYANVCATEFRQTLVVFRSKNAANSSVVSWQPPPPSCSLQYYVPSKVIHHVGCAKRGSAVAPKVNRSNERERQLGVCNSFNFQKSVIGRSQSRGKNL